MKGVKINRFLGRKPEKISFHGAPIPDTPLKPATKPNQAENEAPGHATGTLNVPMNERSSERPNVPTNAKKQHSIDPPNCYYIQRPLLRKKSRQSFDVFEDQKTALDKLQLAIADAEGRKKPGLGELVQQALDVYIQSRTQKLQNVRIVKETKPETNENPNVRPDERS